MGRVSSTDSTLGPSTFFSNLLRVLCWTDKAHEVRFRDR